LPKILTVVGARPQFIKAAPVSAVFAAQGLGEYLVHTGQHYDRDMSKIFFEELGIRIPDLNLNIGSGSHGAQTGAMLAGLEQAMIVQKPDWVLVYGDTNSTLAGALAAAKLNVPVAHVEAGLRSFNRRMPEEINRVVADAVAMLLFVPTEAGRQNLLREGVPADRIRWTGDVMFDALLMFRQQAARTSTILVRLGLLDAPFVLATIHRAENTDDPARLQAIMEGFGTVAESLRVILPLHPRTRARLVTMQGIGLGRIEIINPVGFLDMIRLESAAQVIATDSGGVQKEAFFQGVPCVTLRDETEWIESVELGWNQLVSPVDPSAIAQAILLARGKKGRPASPYGDGAASKRIAEAIEQAVSG
jgi:UDP-GlcNAc3NAcA epimerase